MNRDNFEIFFEQPTEQKPASSYSYWEVQRKDNFRGGSIQTNETFRFKNLATGLFLA